MYSYNIRLCTTIKIKVNYSPIKKSMPNDLENHIVNTHTPPNFPAIPGKRGFISSQTGNEKISADLVSKQDLTSRIVLETLPHISANLVPKQDLISILNTVLRGPERFSSHLEIADSLAKPKPKLFDEQDLQILTALRGLVEHYADEQNLTDSMQIIAALRELAEYIPEHAGVAVCLAYGLARLSDKQDLTAGIMQTVAELRKLAKRFPADAKIAAPLAIGLFNLSVVQDVTGRIQTVAELRELAERFPADAEIAAPVARGLANLFVKQNLTGRIQILTDLRGLTQRFPDNKEIAAIAAQAEQDF